MHRARSITFSRASSPFYIDTASGVRRVTAAAGSVVPLAGDVPHTIRNESDSDAVGFVVHAPGAPMVQFSRSVAAMAGPRDMAAVLQVAARSGIELLGPVPSLG
jgi:hypothetical protein